MIFLDTDIISYFFAGSTTIRDHLRENINKGEVIGMTSVNVYEVLKGLKYRNNLSKEKQFMDFLRGIVVFTLDKAALVEAANIYAESKKSGKPAGDADILIAAIVISNDGLLVSNNTRHYVHIKNLRLANWV
ncbi:MAG: PIN domain-containing protein [Synergistaceae bacterium]|nr:PIN domain-containing protein [Synergistaceae bacterium]